MRSFHTSFTSCSCLIFGRGSSPEATKLPFVSPITFLVLLMSCHWKNFFLFNFVSVKSFGSPPDYLLDPLRYKHCCCWNKSSTWRCWSWHKNNSPLLSLMHLEGLGLGKKLGCNTLSLPELSACPSDLIPCPEATSPEAGAHPSFWKKNWEKKEHGTITLFCIHATITLFCLSRMIACSTAS